MCRLRNIAMRESVTTGQTDGQTLDKVIPMCRYALRQHKNMALDAKNNFTVKITLSSQLQHHFIDLNQTVLVH